MPTPQSHRLLQNVGLIAEGALPVRFSWQSGHSRSLRYFVSALYSVLEESVWRAFLPPSKFHRALVRFRGHVAADPIEYGNLRSGPSAGDPNKGRPLTHHPLLAYVVRFAPPKYILTSWWRLKYLPSIMFALSLPSPGPLETSQHSHRPCLTRRAQKLGHCRINYPWGWLRLGSSALGPSTDPQLSVGIPDHVRSRLDPGNPPLRGENRT